MSTPAKTAQPSPALQPNPIPPNPRQILLAKDLATFNQRSNLSGGVQMLAHLGVMVVSGLIWGLAPSWLAIPALWIYGTSMALMFCAMHECAHRTAFANPKVNDSMAWLAGFLSFYNSTFYRRYHKWHHRYTQIPGKDPELGDPKPETLAQYLWQLTGLPWWKGKVLGHGRVAIGQLEDCFFLPESAHQDVIMSTRLQLGAYLVLFGMTVALGQPTFFVTYWLLPLAVGQPMLRFILLAEHSNCTHDDNPLTNTRTTLTLWPLRFLMWNMPYHAEHHLYPSIPFHALSDAHQQLKKHFAIVESGYVRVHQGIVTAFD